MSVKYEILDVAAILGQIQNIFFQQQCKRYVDKMDEYWEQVQSTNMGNFCVWKQASKQINKANKQIIENKNGLYAWLQHFKYLEKISKQNNYLQYHRPTFTEMGKIIYDEISGQSETNLFGRESNINGMHWNIWFDWNNVTM